MARINWTPMFIDYDRVKTRSKSFFEIKFFFSSVFDPYQTLAPILLRDSITMLLQLLMSVPINLTSGKIYYFNI
jgi:hypothetical protein